MHIYCRRTKIRELRRHIEGRPLYTVPFRVFLYEFLFFLIKFPELAAQIGPVSIGLEASPDPV